MRARVRSRGLALVAVLWIVAALAVMVTSLSHAVRQEVRAVSTSRQALAAQALGQGSIHLVLQDLAARLDRPARAFWIDAHYAGVPVTVHVLPLNGLIDLNNAPQGLLALLFQHGGGVDPGRAQSLAAAAVAWRSALDTRGRAVGFEAAEDLLRVPGVDYPLYARLATLVSADLRGSGRVNVHAAPPEVLAVLAGGDRGRAEALAVARDAGQPTLDLTALRGEYVETLAATSRYRLLARVPLAAGTFLQVMRTVDFAAARHGVPWRILHGHHQFESIQ